MTEWLLLSSHSNFYCLQKSILRSRGQTIRGRAPAQVARNNLKRALAVKKAVNVRNLKRSNSLTTFVP